MSAAIPIDIVSAAGSLVILGLVLWVGLKRSLGEAFGLGFVLTVLFLFIPLSWAWLGQAFFLSLVALFCTPFRPPPRVFVTGCVAVILCSWGIQFTQAKDRADELARLRAEHPIVSVSERLAYEESRRQEQAVPDDETRIAAEVLHRLSQSEEPDHWQSRGNVLRRLHDRTQDAFIVANGFGRGRMAYVPTGRLRLPETPAVPLPPLVAGYDAELSAQLADEEPGPASPQRSDLLSLHSTGLTDFLNPDLMGYAENRDHVIGFRPHQFTSVPTVAGGKGEPSDWQVARLELISLLRYETPVAYVSEHLPKMDELVAAPTRALTDFERNALDVLRTDDDLVVDDRGDRTRMVGSVRAGKNCLTCHSVRRGELLGAFTYELVPTRPPAVKPVEEPLKPQA